LIHEFHPLAIAMVFFPMMLYFFADRIFPEKKLLSA
jgi:hypothetical protein